MARSIPVVKGTMVTGVGEAGTPLVCGSPAWYAWLDTATTFAFAGTQGTFTARRQPGKPGAWRAYRRGKGTVHSVYLGTAADLTPDRLAAAALSLAHPHAPGARPPGSTPPRTDPPPLPILPTKLYAAPARPDVVARPHLLARLAAGVAGPLTLICAPAGFGKTTLLAAWRGQTAQPAVAWLSLDAEDSDPFHFLRYLVAALRTTDPRAGATLLPLLQAAPRPPPAALRSMLINDLAALAAPTVLVLDDYHVLQGAAIHELLAFLVDHLPPALHLVLATREDPPLPLARLRARRQLTELRAEDLRFTTDEAAAFLGEVMGLNLPPAAVAALEARTEGWVAGLQLAALSLRDQPDVSGFITAFTGSHRYILDYLIEEVLNRQPPAVQRFLVCTSILDRLCGPLGDAVCGDLGLPGVAGTPGAPGSQAILLELERANCFLVPLDAERHWYRYHHLFADLLRAWLAREPAPFRQALHRRASAWYAQEGWTAEAVEHALAGGDFAQATRLIEQNAEALWRHGELATLQHWLAALPPEVVAGRVRLLLTQAWTRFLHPVLPRQEIAPLLTAAQALLDASPPAEGATSGDDVAELRGMLLAIQSSLASGQADPAQALVLAREALACLPAASSYWRCAAQPNLGLAHLTSGDLAAASQMLDQARHSAQAGGNPYAALAATVHLGRIQSAQGHLRGAAAFFQQAIDLAARAGSGLAVHAAAAHIELSTVLVEWNDLEAAAAHLTDGLAHAEGHAHSGLPVVGYGDLARVTYLRGDLAGAEALLARAAQAAQATDLPWIAALAETYWVGLWLLQGHPAAGAWRAGQWLDDETRRAAGTESRPGWAAGQARRTRARVLLVQGRPDAALAILQPSEAAANGSTHRLREIHLLTALAWQAQGAQATALGVLRPLLEEMEGEGYRRVFLDEGPPM
jgi:LuxR family maltose regulon positive regulatory protein